MTKLVAAWLDKRFDGDGVYLLRLDGGHLDDGEHIEFNTFFIVDSGVLFGATQRDGPITLMRDKLPKDIATTLTREAIEDPMGLVNLLRDPRVKIERFA
jgi:hypothetical protein